MNHLRRLVIALVLTVTGCIDPTISNTTEEIAVGPVALKQTRDVAKLDHDRFSIWQVSDENRQISLIQVAESSAHSQRRFVLYFPGGPRLSPISSGIVRLLKRHYDNGVTDVYVVAHTGTTSPIRDGTKDLGDFGLAATKRDAVLIADFLNSAMVNRDRQVIVHGHSFGSLAATMTAALAPQNVDRLVVQAPFYFPRPVADIVEDPRELELPIDGAIVPVSRASVAEDIRYLYEDLLRLSIDQSGSAEGDQFIAQLRNQACSEIASPTLFLFGEYEDRADAQQTLEFIQCFQNAEIHISRAAPHGSELATPDARQVLHDFLSCADSQDCE